MLELASVSWKNFLSYGNYQTTLELANRGQCLITGEIVDDDIREGFDSDLVLSKEQSKNKRSNGAGKSVIPSVIQWVLFGRTMHSSSPGDAIINWYTGKDCWGKITFKNGDSIIRTRNVLGNNELYFTHNGDEHKFVSDTVSTAKNQQTILAKTYGLDWEMFCGGAFFTQYGKPWMEMSDQIRKRAFERLLHADRFSYYSKSGKIKIDALDMQISECNLQKSSLESDITRSHNEITRLTSAIETFDINLKERHDEALRMAAIAAEKRDNIIIPDIDKLILKWNIVDKIKSKINTDKEAIADLNNSIDILDRQINTQESKIESLNSKIKLWNDKNGKICASCEQLITKDHVDNRIEPYIKQIDDNVIKLNDLNLKMDDLKQRKSVLKAVVVKSESLLAASLPKMTVQQAQSIAATKSIHDDEYNRLLKLSKNILNESNPHVISLEDVNKKLDNYKKRLDDIKNKIEQLTHLNKHYVYVQKAYTDRTKIKSFAFKDHVPYINSRLRHYLDVFGLDVKLELTDSLSMSSNMWGYDFESGGERKKTDVALMLATFDFHEYMYGRQCNILVLDEVDGRLDDDGVESLINIIKTDLADRVETLLIISHKNTMRDVFPNEIRVRRVKRFSYLEST